MANGHVNRTNRPNTWLHRPACKREEKPCQLGAVHTWHKVDIPTQSVNCLLSRAKRTCTVAWLGPPWSLLTRSGHRPDRNPAAQHLLPDGGVLSFPPEARRRL